MSRTRWAMAAMAAVAVAVGGVANAIDDAELPSGWRTLDRGEVGTDVTVEPFQLHVHGATASREFDDYGDLLTSPGYYVVVEVSYAATDQWRSPDEFVLLDAAGREFGHPGGFGFTGSAWSAGPDIWMRGDLLFEVPEDALGTMTLELRPDLPNPLLPATLGQVEVEVTTTELPVSVADPELLPEGDR